MAVFDRGSKVPATFFMPEPAAHRVRVVKASEAASLLPPDKNGHNHNPNVPRKPAEVRLVGTGPDYVDLEFVCGCGEVTKFRCWNNPGDNKAAAA